jgi:hypothetical protein
MTRKRTTKAATVAGAFIATLVVFGVLLGLHIVAEWLRTLDVQGFVLAYGFGVFAVMFWAITQAALKERGQR